MHRSSIAGLAVVALVLVACGGSAPAAPEAGSGSDARAGAEDASAGAGDGVGADVTPIAIGFLGELTGSFAVWGVPARNGMRLAVDDVNAAGGIDGRPVELVERDTRGAPEEAVTAFQGMIDREGVVAVGGVVSSDVGLAAARVAEEDEVPLFLVKAGSERILDASSRHVFRTCLPAAPMNLPPLAAFVEDEGLERIGAIVADYAWGRAIEDAVRDAFSAVDVELRIEVAPVAETDFTGYLRRLEDLDPDLLIATGHPPGSTAITRQAAELGFDGLVVGPYAASASVVEGAGALAFDRYVDFACADFASEGYRELATRYHEAFGAFMENDAVAGYGQVVMVAETLEAIDSDDPGALAEGLHDRTFTLPGYAYELSWTPWGELAAARPMLTVLRERPPPDGVNPGADWYPEVLFRSEALEPFRP